jgi:ATP-dependent protease ClpP protease subunit
MSDLKPYTIYTTESVFKDHHIWFYSFESDMPDLMNLIANTMGGIDCVHFHMNNEGGDMLSGMQLLTVIQEAMGRGTEFVLHVESNCDSMASVFICKLITMGVETHFGEHFTVMFHSPSGGGGETMRIGDILDDMHHFNMMYLQLLKTSCTGILSEQEINQIVSGKELRIEHADFVLRCSNLIDKSETIH